MAPLPASACRAEVALVVRPRDLNTYQKVFGGFVMERVDDLATGLVAAVAGRTAVTAHLDRLTFSAGISAFQRMRLIAQGTRTFRTSMEVSVEVRGEDPLTGRVWSTAQAALTVVGLDEGGRPTPLPAIAPTTPREREAFAAAGERRLRRLAERGRPGEPPAAAGAGPAADRAADIERLSFERCSRLVSGRHAAEAGQASAGWILSAADELAAICASRHGALPCVTAAVDDVSFVRPVPVGDVVVLEAYLTATFRTSMEVRVDVWHRPRYGRTRTPVARCAFTYVALDPSGRPAPVPPFVPATAEESARAEEARRRRERRAGPATGSAAAGAP